MANEKKTPKPNPTTNSRKARSAGTDDPQDHLVSDTTLESPNPLEFTATTLSKPDQLLLRRTMRFLVGILEPGLVDRARREGYSRKEHELGWLLWRTAAGETRPFEHWLREQQLVEGEGEGNVEQRRRLQEIDVFENTWFPRTRAIIRRVVSKERRDAFAAAFFKDLVQQPLGPSVVGSVSTFLTRLAGLETSSDPDAKAVRATLRSRGLTEGKLATITQLLEEARAGVKTSHKGGASVTAEDLEKARVAQLDAVEGLRDWWNDWGVTLRGRYGVREQIRLGLTARKRGSNPDLDGDVEVEGDEAEVDDGEAGGRERVTVESLVSA